METRNPVRRRVFAHSLSDVFEDRPELIPWQQDLFQLWHDTPRLDWLVLTKDPAHMLTLTPPAGFPSNVALGVSVENDEWAYKRIPFLLQSKAKVKFVSVEPMLGALDLTPYLGGLSWVICGSESGNSRRPFDVALAEYLYHQCDQAGVKFYMKQGSALKPGQQGEIPDWLWKIKQFPVFGGKIDVGSV
jgi:protein gp37